MFLSFKQFLVLFLGLFCFLFFSKKSRKTFLSFIKKSFVVFSKKKK